MTKKIILTLIMSITLHADIIDFYKKAVHTLQYNQTYLLNKKANKLSQKGINDGKYANFTLNADYGKTKAKQLTNAFDTTNITLNDTLDVFGKNSYKIETLALDLKSQKALLNGQKEQLFIALVKMITVYHKTLAQHTLYESVLNEQQAIYDKLKKLQQQGAMTRMDVLRFENQLTSLKMSKINQENEMITMQKQLQLYAPNQAIPTLESSELHASEKAFVSQNPQLSLNNTEADKLLVEAKGLTRAYLPDLTVGTAYQQIADPTSYGDNYAVTVGVHIPLNSGNFKETEALKVKALSLKSKNIAYQIQRKNAYTTRHQTYINATQQLTILQSSLNNYEESEKTIKTAYLQQYVDFNTYTQVILQTLQVKEKMLELESKKEEEATILNNIASGVIYE